MIIQTLEELLKVICPKCKQKGFKWGREYCSYCGETVVLEKELLKVIQKERKEKDHIVIQKIETIEKLKELNCPKCKRKGFKWAREYCVYCGEIVPLNNNLLENVQKLRSEKDEYLAEENKKLDELVEARLRSGPSITDSGSWTNN